MASSDHAAHMHRALELARRGWGRVRPNPLVGAVLVRDGEVVGEGWHAELGAPHAEIMALNAAGERARQATLYVTLEPCTHHGRTPPCTDAIIEAGVLRVVFAAADPNAAAGGGARRLRDAGVDVVAGVERDAVRDLDPGFFHRHERDTPFVTLKLAVSLDGRIAGAPGTRTPITGPAARIRVHELRAYHDAVLVGSRTALVDDPLLTVRCAPVREQPTRVVLDSVARLPVDSQLVRSIDQAPLLVVCSAAAPAARVRALEAAGVTVRQASAAGAGLDLNDVARILHDEDLRTIFVEGGGRIATSFLAASLVDRIRLFMAPLFIGTAGVPAFELDAAPAARWLPAGVERCDDDVLITLRPDPGVA